MLSAVLLSLSLSGPALPADSSPCSDAADKEKCLALLRLKAAARQRPGACGCTGPNDCKCPPGACPCPNCHAEPAGAVLRGEIEVVCPPDALIDFDGHRTRQTGTTRLFFTPLLKRQSAYTVKCSRGVWSEEKRVSVGPGQIVHVEFTPPAPAAAAAVYPANFGPGPGFCFGGS